MAGTIKFFSPSATATVKLIEAQPLKTFRLFPIRISFPNSKSQNALTSCSKLQATESTTSNYITSSTSSSSSNSNPHHWMVIMKRPPEELQSKPEIIDYYVKILASVMGSEKEAQMCIYHASWHTNFGFCCDIDDETRRQLVCLPQVLSVRPDQNVDSLQKNYRFDTLFGSSGGNSLFSLASSKYWIVCVDKPSVEIVSKAQMVDYYAHILTKVLGNEKDAQMCIYHISWENNLGFCCELDEDCAQELAGVPGVLSVQPDKNFGSDYKNYEGDGTGQNSDAQVPAIKTKRLFVTGLSFYTSEKTLRAAFEGFGELVEVKIIMDKISKRSKGYAFIEYTTEEAAGSALKEMNGKIINGWMIVVDVAKTNPPKYSRGSPRPRY